MKGKRKLTQRILSLLMVFAMVMGMLLEPVQIYAAQPGSGVEVRAGGNQGDGMNPPAENQFLFVKYAPLVSKELPTHIAISLKAQDILSCSLFKLFRQSK